MAARLGAFINTLEERGIFHFDVNRFDSRLRLQKYIYLVEKFNVPLNYTYSLYIRGPYSPTLAVDYYHLPRDLISGSMELPESFLNLINRKSKRWLELASTICMLHTAGTTREDLIERLIKIKDSSEAEINPILEELDENRLLN